MVPQRDGDPERRDDDGGHGQAEPDAAQPGAGGGQGGRGRGGRRPRGPLAVEAVLQRRLPPGRRRRSEKRGRRQAGAASRATRAKGMIRYNSGLSSVPIAVLP